MPYLVSVSESNGAPFSNVDGSVGQPGTFEILGVARAGRSDTGVGSAFQGTYGRLTLNSDGSWSYALDNADADTQQLGTGQSADERFTYTYELNGVAHTDTLVLRVSGLDEPGQAVTTYSNSYQYNGDLTIGPLQRLVFPGSTSLLLANPSAPVTLVNQGSILGRTQDTFQTIPVALWNSWHAATLRNEGLVDALAHNGGYSATAVSWSGAVLNTGVVRARVEGMHDWGPRADGVTAQSVVNSGTIEAIAEHGVAFAVGLRPGRSELDNSGLIYAFGATATAVVADASGVALQIVNSGVIHAETAGANGSTAIGIDVTVPVGIVNSGRIVADTAVSITRHQSLHLSNSGWIEGDLIVAAGFNHVANEAGGSWTGDLVLGTGADVVTNHGSIVGDVFLGAGADLFDGRGGSVVGTVYGMAGMDVLFGGSGADSLDGGDAADRIAGGGGADRLNGGAGGDVFVYASLADSADGAEDLIEDFQSGSDRIDLSQLAPQSVSISAQGAETIVRAQTAQGMVSIRVVGTVMESDLILVPQALTPTEGDDLLFATGGAVEVEGGGGNDLLSGSDADDRLDGGSGDDTMRGDLGDDTYVVDQGYDTVVELAGEGTDTVLAPWSYRLPDGVENLTITQPNYFLTEGFGNELDNVIIGNSSIDRLYGGDGDDTLEGGGAADRLYGGGGADTFVYRSVSDSPEEQYDAIGGFEVGIDKIDVSRLSVSALHYTEYHNPWSGSSYYREVSLEVAGGTLLIRLDAAATLDDFLFVQPGPAGGARNDIYETDEAGTVSGNVLGNDTGGQQVAEVNGSAAAVGQQVALSNGATLLLNADGSFTYDPNGAFNALTAPGSGAVNTSAVGIFTYRLTDGSTASVYVTVNGLVSADDLLMGDANNNTITGTSGDDIIEGRAGSDTLIGGDGNDVYFFRHQEWMDNIIETATGGTDLVLSANTATLAAYVENLRLTGTNFVDGTGNELANIIVGNLAANHLKGLTGDDTLKGEGGNDTLDGGAGLDTMTGGDGDDSYVVQEAGDVVVELDGGGTDLVTSHIGYTLGDYVENLTLVTRNAIDGYGNALNNVILGNEAANLLSGGDGDDSLGAAGGDDTLDGGAGADYMSGGNGNDTFIVDDAGDQAIEKSATGGIDLVLSSVSFTLTANVENLTLTGTGAVNATGNGLANVLTGNAAANSLGGAGGDDILDGGVGADTMTGGTGDDVYYADVAGDVVVEAAGEGTDEIRTGLATYSLAGIANVERLTGLGAGAHHLTGNNLVNRLDGGLGADTMAGGLHNDTYVVDNVGDVVVENANEGVDTIESSVSWTLGSNVENLTLTGAAAINATGNAGANILYGNSGANRLDGGAGADRMSGGDGDDRYIVDDIGDRVFESSAAGGYDTVFSSVAFSLTYQYLERLELTGSANVDATGNSQANTLVGNAGANILDGGIGVDVMGGRGGDDTYIVDHVGDSVIESAGGGTDTVLSYVTFHLSRSYEIENLTLLGSSNVNVYGNHLNNRLEANDNNNILNGSEGADIMIGRKGTDTYYVDNEGDVVVEEADGGVDTVRTWISYTLGDHVENVGLEGNAAANLTGNALNNRLSGNHGANRLDGGAGADVMNGYRGDDIYIVDNIGDVVQEFDPLGGNDTVLASVSYRLSGTQVETLQLTGNAAIDATGHNAANTLIGNDAANRLYGKLGNDVLQGGGGADGFMFDTALDGTNNVDAILDFSVADDTIHLSRGVFGGIAADGTLAASAFRTGTAAQDADDRIVYDSATGSIFYDADGSGAGAAVLFATVTAGTQLTHLDFSVYTPGG